MPEHTSWYAGKRILITGGAGSIGSNLTRAVAELGADRVIVLDDLSAAYEWNIPTLPNVRFVRASVTDQVALEQVFDVRPDVVYHLAAFFANQNSVDHPERDLMTNGMGTLRVFQHAVKSGARRVVYASSGCSIYGSEAELPLREDVMSLRLSTPYQITKMLGELYANYFQHQFDLPVVKTRFFNSYGPGEVPGQYRNVIPNFIYLALSGRPLPITGSGAETRDFTYVTDIVNALLRAGYYDSAIGQEMNIASGCEVRISDLAEQINELTGNNAGVVKAAPRRWDTKKRLLASIERAHQLIGYSPEVTFQQGLQQTVAWFREHWTDIQRCAEFAADSSLVTEGHD